MDFNFQIVFRVTTLEDGKKETLYVSFAGQSSKDLNTILDDCVASVTAMPMQFDYSLVSSNYSPVKNPFEDEKKTE